MKKHDISFEEAKSVFFDENALEFYDFYHSHEEERFLMLGLSELHPANSADLPLP